MGYLQGNRDYVVQEIRRRLPAIKLHSPESTYLAWLESQQLHVNETRYDHFLQQAKVAFSNGVDFGNGGDGCVRLNFATSRNILEQTVERMVASL